MRAENQNCSEINSTPVPMSPGLCAAGATLLAAGLGASIPGIILAGVAGLIFGGGHNLIQRRRQKVFKK